MVGFYFISINTVAAALELITKHSKHITMIQAMKFSQPEGAIEVCELTNDRLVCINVTSKGGGHINGYVQFDERRLRELRNWCNVQLAKMQKMKIQPVTKR